MKVRKHVFLEQSDWDFLGGLCRGHYSLAVVRLIEDHRRLQKLQKDIKLQAHNVLDSMQLEDVIEHYKSKTDSIMDVAERYMKNRNVPAVERRKE